MELQCREMAEAFDARRKIRASVKDDNEQAASPFARVPNSDRICSGSEGVMNAFFAFQAHPWQPDRTRQGRARHGAAEPWLRLLWLANNLSVGNDLTFKAGKTKTKNRG
jgi:hypothetical protein